MKIRKRQKREEKARRGEGERLERSGVIRRRKERGEKETKGKN